VRVRTPERSGNEKENWGGVPGGGLQFGRKGGGLRG